VSHPKSIYNAIILVVVISFGNDNKIALSPNLKQTFIFLSQKSFNLCSEKPGSKIKPKIHDFPLCNRSRSTFAEPLFQEDKK